MMDPVPPIPYTQEELIKLNDFVTAIEQEYRCGVEYKPDNQWNLDKTTELVEVHGYTLTAINEFLNRNRLYRGNPVCIKEWKLFKSIDDALKFTNLPSPNVLAYTYDVIRVKTGEVLVRDHRFFDKLNENT